jgi:twinkle protein
MNQTVKDISRMLSERAEDICQKLLPGGKKNGAEWECDSIAGNKGKSLKVRLSGDRAGVWADFATGSDSGDLLDLWAASRGVTLSAAIVEAKEYLGIREPRFEPTRKTYVKPKQKPAPSGDAVTRYLSNERKLLPETIERFKIGSSRNGEWIVFPSHSPTGELLNAKHIAIARDESGKKQVSTERDCAPSLFGWQAFKGGRVVVITEGEIDAMTVHQYGIAALSVPFGAGRGNKNEWIDFEWENLAQFETIYLCYDSDEAGQSCVEEVARRLGIHRCRSVKLHWKDPNEGLQNGMPEEEFLACLSESKSFDPPEIRSPLEFRERVQSYFYPSEDQKNAVLLPVLFHRKIGFRPGELTIWTGCNSHGKSVMIGQVMIGAAVRDMKIAIASMEMRPEQTLGRMLKQFWACGLPSAEEINRGLEWMSGRIWIYDLMGNVPTSKLMELLEFSVRRHGVSHFVIDSLMKCDVGGEDYDGQRRFLNEAVTFAKNHNCHIHLIAHPRKHDEEKPIGRIAVSGSGDISNQADNVVSVWRNKAKERNEKTWTERDCVVLCDKQRETGWEGYIDLDFWKKQEQYIMPGQNPQLTKYHEWAFNRPPDEPEQLPSVVADVELPGSWSETYEEVTT